MTFDRVMLVYIAIELFVLQLRVLRLLRHRCPDPPAPPHREFLEP